MEDVGNSAPKVVGVMEVPDMPTPDAALDDRSKYFVARVGVGKEADIKALQQTVRPIMNGNPSLVVAEKPVYRLVCYMALRGKTNKEIGEELEMHPTKVSNILKQPWARKFMTDEARAMAGGEVMDLLKGESAKSVRTLIELRDNEELPANVRLSATNSILDRALGKPVQQVVTEKAQTYDDAAREAVEIDRELDALRRKALINVTPTRS